jgi:hypothetical protein
MMGQKYTITETKKNTHCQNRQTIDTKRSGRETDKQTGSDSTSF